MVPNTNGDYYMTDKLFTVAGTSKVNGTVKFKVANGTAKDRSKALERAGQTDVNLQDLPRPMTKEEAMSFLNYVDGKPAAKAPAAKPAKAVKPAKPAKAPKLKAVKPIKTVVTTEAPPQKEETSPSLPKKNADEIVRIKAKNLETMRAVTRRLQAIRSF